MELPDNAFSVQCAGCHGTVYGLEEEDCRQVRLPNILGMSALLTTTMPYIKEQMETRLLGKKNDL